MSYLKKHKPLEMEEDSEGTWAVSYGDMITLLLSFFVIFYNTDFEKQKIEKVNRHLGFELDHLKPILTEKTKGTPVETMPGGSVVVTGLSDFDIKVHEVDENLVVTFGKLSFFESGSTEVKKETIEMLKLFTEKYLPYAGKYQLSIKGFTDRKPVRKDRRNYKDNLELSVLRAVSAMRHLQKAGIPLNRMEIAGVGELRTIEKIFPKSHALSQKELEALSRTVVLVIKPEKESLL